MPFIKCPLPATIDDIVQYDCEEAYGQIVRLFFQRQGTPFAAADILDVANWTPLLTAVDGTKIQTAPVNENFVIPGTEPILEGGDTNETAYGLQKVNGGSQVEVTGRYRGMPSDSRGSMKQFISESSQVGKLGVYLVNSQGDLIVIADADVATEYNPVGITSYFIGDPGSEGLNAPNLTMFRWSMPYDWSRYAKIIKNADLNFDPRTFGL